MQFAGIYLYDFTWLFKRNFVKGIFAEKNIINKNALNSHIIYLPLVLRYNSTPTSIILIRLYAYTIWLELYTSLHCAAVLLRIIFGTRLPVPICINVSTAI